MQLIHTVADLRGQFAGQGPAPVLVPTMGNLHDGHLALVRQARSLAGATGARVVASVFVNRLQFAPHEDFDTYPRTLERDASLLAEAGCDLMFAPSEAELYPEPQGYKVVPPTELADILEGAFRLGFFTGVCTVVHKLFNLVQPQAAVFGKKDYQQLMVLRNMVRQMGLPIDIHAGETLRADDGLALSSRHGYLSPADRSQAVELIAALRAVREECQGLRAGGIVKPEQLVAIGAGALTRLADRGWKPDYVAIRRQNDLREPGLDDLARDVPLVVVAAARLGATRLIDNLEWSA